MPNYFEFKREHFDILNGWEVLIGATKTKLIKHDFDRNSHLVVAGTTGSGKSVFLKSVISTLVARQTKNTNLFLIDLKGGVALNRFSRLEQVEGFAKNPVEALIVLKDAQARMNAQLDYLLAYGYEDMKEAGFADRFFIIIDEAADIGQHEECQSIVEDIARRGRAAGFNLIYCSQYVTTQVMSSQVKQNCSSQVCFRLKTEIASRVVLDEGGAEKIPIIPGRAIYRADKKIDVQTPFMSNDFINETIKPHITFKGRKEGYCHETNNREGTKNGSHTLHIEEIGLR
ncbi:FtsK/SpoIIIE domain-containing protein [Bacillus sp. JJ722]|uniref:FtsK/SpoIIIE domain-containing protein n=1 Tax=Bacillus sp. JJ722 TaxID=3122973 RepID=UPI002FFE87AD